MQKLDLVWTRDTNTGTGKRDDARETVQICSGFYMLWQLQDTDVVDLGIRLSK
jgi:hypothetical protein